MSLARSGTTTLLNFLHSSDAFASLSYEDMPFLASPNIWLRIRGNIQLKKDANLMERAHGDGISISHQTPEAFEEYIWNLISDDDAPIQVKHFKNYTDLVCYRYQKTRYLSKNNQNIKRSCLFEQGLVAGIYIHLIRHPISHVVSIMNQHARFNHLQLNDDFILQYMRFIGHHEFGRSYEPLFQENTYFPNYDDPNHWLEQWCIANESMGNFTNNVDSSITIVLEKFSQQESCRVRLMERLGVSGCNQREIKPQQIYEPLPGMDKSLVKRALSIYDLALQKCEY